MQPATLAFHLDWQQAVKMLIFYLTVPTSCAQKNSMSFYHVCQSNRSWEVIGGWGLEEIVCICVYIL